jgi:hypothetical protein
MLQKTGISSSLERGPSPSASTPLTMPRLALNRKDMQSSIVWRKRPLYRRLGLERDDLIRGSSSRSNFLFEHDLFGKLVPSFPDHALADRETLLLWRYRGRYGGLPRSAGSHNRGQAGYSSNHPSSYMAS